MDTVVKVGIVVIIGVCLYLFLKHLFKEENTETLQIDSVQDFKNSLSEIQTNEITELIEKKDYYTTIDKCRKLLNSQDLSDESLMFLHNSLGSCYGETKQYQLAISEYNASLDIDSDFVLSSEARMGLSIIYVFLGRIDEAIALRDKIFITLEEQLNLSRRSGMKQSEVVEAEKEIKELKKQLTKIYDLIQPYVEKRYEEILMKYVFEPISPLNFSDSNLTILAYDIICDSFVKVKKYDELLDYILSQNDSMPIFDIYRGIAYYHQSHFETALQCLDRGINAGETDNPDAWGYKGECHFIFNEYNKAIDAYVKALNTKNPMNDGFEETYLGDKIRLSKERLAQTKAQAVPSHITIQGNSAPISFGGVIATDNAIVNRPTVTNEPMKKCPYCGAEIKNDDKFCSKCGKQQ